MYSERPLLGRVTAIFADDTQMEVLIVECGGNGRAESKESQLYLMTGSRRKCTDEVCYFNERKVA